MMKKVIKTIGIMALVGILFAGCGSVKKYQCSECGKTVSTVYYDIADSERYLCKNCAEEYYDGSLPFEMYEVGKQNVDEFMGVDEADLDVDAFEPENEEKDGESSMPSEGLSDEKILIEMQNKYPTADLLIESNELSLESGKQECTLNFVNGADTDSVSGKIYNTYIYSMESGEWEIRESSIIPETEVDKNIGISKLMELYPNCNIVFEENKMNEDGSSCSSSFRCEASSDACDYWSLINIGYEFDTNNLEWIEKDYVDLGIQEIDWHFTGTYTYEKLNTFTFVGNEAVFYLKVKIEEPDFEANTIEIGYAGNIDKATAYEGELQYTVLPFAIVDNEIQIQGFNCIQQIKTDTGIYQYGGDYQIIVTVDGVYCRTKSGAERIYKVQ